MLIGAVVSLGHVSLTLSVDGRDTRQRVAAVDERQQTTETGAVVMPDRRPAAAEPTAPTVAEAPTTSEEPAVERSSRRLKP
jgi:hypothetical protein